MEHYTDVANRYHDAWCQKKDSDFEYWVIGEIIEMFKGDNTMRVVDIGGGTGRMASVIADKLELREGVICVDPSEDMLQQIQDKNKVIPYNADAIGFLEDQTYLFDRILIKEVIHHVDEDKLQHLFNLLASKLNENGIILIITRPQSDIEYPFSSKAKEIWEQNQQPLEFYTNFINQSGLSVNTELEQQYTQTPSSIPVEQEVRDALYPARELAKAAQEAERQRKWEEEQAQYLKLQQLRQSFSSSNLPLPTPGSTSSNSNLRQFSSFQSDPNLAIPSVPLPKAPVSTTDQYSTTQSGFGSNIQGNGGSSTSGNDFYSSFNSLLQQSPSPQGQYQHYDLPPVDSTNMPSFSDSYNVPQAYQNSQNPDGHRKMEQGGNFPQSSFSQQPGYGSGSGSGSGDDLSDRIKRLSSVPDFNSYQQQQQIQQQTDSSDSQYYNGTQSSFLPPSYSSSQFDPNYQSQSSGNGQGYSSGDNQQFRNSNPDDSSLTMEPLYQDFGVCDKGEDFISEEDWNSESVQSGQRYPNANQAMYHGERMAYSRNSKFKKKAAKILIPIATTSGGVVAGALGGAAIGAAVSGGIAAPVGAVIGAVVGGSAGCSAGIAATNNKKFDNAMVSKGSYGRSKCGNCLIALDCLAAPPVCCPTCQRLFCSNCVHRSSNSNTYYCQYCIGGIESPNYRRIEYRK